MGDDFRSVSAPGSASPSAPASVICSLCGVESIPSERRTCSNCGAVFVAAHHPSGERRPYREVVVFSGTLTMRRDKVAAAVTAAGWEVAANVNGRTTILVLGVQDMSKFAGADKSTKERKAESLIAGGQKIRIVDEGEFWRLIDPADG